MLKIAVLAKYKVDAKKLLEEIVAKEKLDGKWQGGLFIAKTNVYFVLDTSFYGKYDQVIVKADTYTDELHKKACHLLRESCVPEEYQILPV